MTKKILCLFMAVLFVLPTAISGFAAVEDVTSQTLTIGTWTGSGSVTEVSGKYGDAGKAEEVNFSGSLTTKLIDIDQTKMGSYKQGDKIKVSITVGADSFFDGQELYPHFGFYVKGRIRGDGEDKYSLTAQYGGTAYLNPVTGAIFQRTNNTAYLPVVGDNEYNKIPCPTGKWCRYDMVYTVGASGVSNKFSMYLDGKPIIEDMDFVSNYHILSLNYVGIVGETTNKVCFKDINVTYYPVDKLAGVDVVHDVDSDISDKFTVNGGDVMLKDSSVTVDNITNLWSSKGITASVVNADGTDGTSLSDGYLKLAYNDGSEYYKKLKPSPTQTLSIDSTKWSNAKTTTSVAENVYGKAKTVQLIQFNDTSTQTMAIDQSHMGAYTAGDVIKVSFELASGPEDFFGSDDYPTYGFYVRAKLGGDKIDMHANANTYGGTAFFNPVTGTLTTRKNNSAYTNIVGDNTYTPIPCPLGKWVRYDMVYKIGTKNVENNKFSMYLDGQPIIEDMSIGGNYPISEMVEIGIVGDTTKPVYFDDVRVTYYDSDDFTLNDGVPAVVESSDATIQDKIADSAGEVTILDENLSISDIEALWNDSDITASLVNADGTDTDSILGSYLKLSYNDISNTTYYKKIAPPKEWNLVISESGLDNVDPGTKSFNVTVYNYAEGAEEENITIYLAFYKNRELIKLDVDNKTVAVNSTVDYACELAVNNAGEADTIKAFIFDEDLNPLDKTQ